MGLAYPHRHNDCHACVSARPTWCCSTWIANPRCAGAALPGTSSRAWPLTRSPNPGRSRSGFGEPLAAVNRYLDRCKLAAHTVKAYRRQAGAYVTWLAAHTADHADAFADVVGAEAAVTAWRRHLLRTVKAKPSSVNQALAAVTLFYEYGARLRIQVKRARVPKPGEPNALTAKQQARVERAAARRGVRDAAIIAVLLYTGPRVEECACLDVEDIAITARTGEVRLLGKGDEGPHRPPSRSRT